MYTCPKCDGKGHIAVYNHVAGGCCFLCNGKGTVERLPRERKPRKQLTPEEKRAKAIKQEQSIIAECLAFADKRASWIGSDGSAILARFAMRRAAVNSVATAREYEESVSKACYRLEQINYAIRSAMTADCNHWSDQTYSAD